VAESSRPQRASIRDVASVAGVSTSTVSRVLLNENKVSDRAREAVLRAIEQTGYVPDVGARGLRSGKTRSIGVSVADLRYPAFVDFIRALGDVVGSRQYPLLLTDAMWDAEIEGFRVRQLLARRVDALVALYPQSMEHFLAAQRGGVPILVIPRAYEQIPESVPRVAIDDLDALRAMMSKVREAGHSRIHYVTRQPGWEERAAHLSPVAREFGVEVVNVDVDLEFVQFVPNDPAAREFLPEGLLQPGGATCLFVAQHAIVAVLGQIKRAGLRVPDDISVIVYGHLDWASLFDPPLDTLELDFAMLGELAGHAVLDVLEGRKRPMQVKGKTVYHARGSVGPQRRAATA
jgi:DNA-binding LacI/PurR family transcriptional regulator